MALMVRSDSQAHPVHLKDAVCKFASDRWMDVLPIAELYSFGDLLR